MSSGKLTPKENIFRKPLRSSAKQVASSINPEQTTSPFKAFDVVLDPGSELDLKTKAELEEKENQRKQSSLMTAYAKPIEKTPVSKKRTVSQITSAGTPKTAVTKTGKSVAPQKPGAAAAGGKTRKLSDFFAKKA